MSLVPSKVFFTKGKGIAAEKLTSFEMALRDAQIAQFNLVKVSSIFPPECQIIKPEEGLSLLLPGQIVFCVMSENSTNESNRLIAASVGVAIPSDKKTFGYLSEHHSFGITGEKNGDYTEDLAIEMLATTLGLPIAETATYDEQLDQWKVSDKIVKTSSITQSAQGPVDGKWVTVLACAVFLL
jgi:arginine decarboxylase